MCGQGHTVLYYTGKANGNAIKFADLRTKIVQYIQYSIRSWIFGSKRAKAIRDWLAVDIEGHHLDACAADVDGKGDGRCCCLGGGFGHRFFHQPQIVYGLASCWSA